MGFLCSSEGLFFYQGFDPKSTNINGNSSTASKGLENRLIASIQHPAAPYRGFTPSLKNKQENNPRLPPPKKKAIKTQKARNKKVVNLQNFFIFFLLIESLHGELSTCPFLKLHPISNKSSISSKLNTKFHWPWPQNHLSLSHYHLRFQCNFLWYFSNFHLDWLGFKWLKPRDVSSGCIPS